MRTAVILGDSLAQRRALHAGQRAAPGGAAVIAPTISAQILRFPNRRRLIPDRTADDCRGRAQLTSACTCRGAGICPTCRAWDLRMRLAELLASSTGMA